ncbi:MAG: translation initiation factor IF-2 [Desulfobacteraceae bacterium]|nr:MAG: translation initiation factor IF-2 [Desulfobacteraceae bacterium]
MGKLRVYELAKEVKISSNELVERLKSAGFPINNYMSSLDMDAVARAKDYLSGATDEILEEKRIKPTIIRRRKKIVPKIEEKVQEELIVEEEVKPSPEEEVSVPEEKVKEVLEEEVEKELKEKPIPEQHLKEAKPKIEKKKKERPKTVPARIIKKADVQPPVTKIQKLVPTIPSFEISTFRGGEVKKEKETKKREKAEPYMEKEVTPRKDYRRRRKEIFERKDLYGDQEKSLVGRGRLKTKGKLDKKKFKQTEITVPKAIKRRIKVPDLISVAELARRMGIKAADLIKELMEIDIMVSINQTIDFDSASLVASEFEYELEPSSFEEDEIINEEEEKPEDLVPRPPVVTIMGHVDHGKTSLLDYIRKSKVIDKEAGGITQHIGAYYVHTSHGDLVFLDTPGHEAFTAMRARGAKVTDLIILVVAADDGVMEQTIEAINHAKAANIPIVVAVNKIDKANADPEKVRRELSKYGFLSEEWGGDTLFSDLSAKTGRGVDELLDSILLQSEILESTANYKKYAKGAIIEARLDKNRGPFATVLIRDGTLHQGDFFVCGENYGRVRAMLNDRGQKIKSATPSMPVEIYGISDVPMAGDDFIVISDEKKAKLISEHRKAKARLDTVTTRDSVSLDNLFDRIKEGEVKELNIIIRADVQGSVEALVDSLTKLSTEDVKLKVLHGATGAVTESDVMLASASKAIIICFNVRANPAARALAEKENVDLRFYDVIYKVIEDIKSAMAGLLEPVYKENIIGRADIKQIFHVSKVGTVAGCYVTDGKIERAANVRLLRDDVVIFDGNISSLKRFKDDVKDVSSGFECGVGLENYNDIKPGDVLEFYTLEEMKVEL